MMKRCAKCDVAYDDAYDACPVCARSPEAKPASAKRMVNGGLVSAGLGLLGLGTLLGSSSAIESIAGVVMLVVAVLAFIGWRSAR